MKPHEIARNRFIGRALTHAYTCNAEALRDLFGRLPAPLRTRAARAVSDRLAAHALMTSDWAWCAWAAHVLPTPYTIALAAELTVRLFRKGA